MFLIHFGLSRNSMLSSLNSTSCSLRAIFPLQNSSNLSFASAAPKAFSYIFSSSISVGLITTFICFPWNPISMVSSMVALDVVIKFIHSVVMGNSFQFGILCSSFISQSLRLFTSLTVISGEMRGMPLGLMWWPVGYIWNSMDFLLSLMPPLLW